MSLQVWLPLNGNTENNGLATGLTSSSITYGTNGKIGGNPKAGGTITGPKSYMEFTGTIAFWFYNGGLSANTIYGNTDTSAVVNNRKWYLTMWPNQEDLHSWGCESDDGTYTGSFTLTGVLPIGKWTHVCVAHDEQKEYIYFNGSLYTTVNWTKGSKPYTFNTPTTISHSLSNGNQIQDIRIYDHCLSPKEVKEISKGLCLHYPLKQPERNKNLATGGLNITSQSGGVHNVQGTCISQVKSSDILNHLGKALILSYDVSRIGENGNTQGTGWQYTRYGIHGGSNIYNFNRYNYSISICRLS